ncbi:MAG TPA: ABC transporter permease [Acidimicrobiales bacterium]|nr:ABC transporter permease [Acidimicrobiales bacterium]
MVIKSEVDLAGPAPRPASTSPRGGTGRSSRKSGPWAAVREMWRARDLAANLLRRDLKVRHRGTFLGMLWSLATPLLIVGLYSFVFTFLFEQPVEDVARPDGQVPPFALYFFAGFVMWSFFSGSVGASTGSITGAGYLLNKVYFPRAILPLSTVLSGVVTFGFELAVLLTAVVVFIGVPGLNLLWTPVVLAVAVMLAFGFALLLSAVTVFLRDTAHFVGVFMQLWFWGTPVLYSLQFVDDRPGLVQLLKLNPVTGLVVSFRNVTLLDHPPAFALLAYDAAFAAVMLAVGAWAFGRWQRVFSEIV